MRYAIIVFWMLFGSMSPAVAQVSIGIGLECKHRDQRTPLSGIPAGARVTRFTTPLR